jgi:predicted lysophospholipase L1 biosynthesis ABC-type transport system permease subunit
VGKPTEPREVEVAREVVARAIRRLDAAEYGILLGAVLFALGGGALVAWLMRSLLDLPFRWAWAVASVLLFVIPAGGVYLQELRSTGRRKATPPATGSSGVRDSNSTNKDAHG